MSLSWHYCGAMLSSFSSRTLQADHERDRDRFGTCYARALASRSLAVRPVIIVQRSTRSSWQNTEGHRDSAYGHPALLCTEYELASG
ncbi:hypothetical protein BKA82DRAFT_728766 [Pisolithus tinctorius]|uniref:Uncharacterized protein n=1 Tax=Pisolithus tinctorius Marx 270 TaxID=870435 RepID=A0A0C3JVZ8_PISTI|nr:hypothetical protein BKA82DRAFT_728766 [Pisolithus tinctorius]KIO01627.1 hypothetical protein M404DRAFT_728766 [Pisolithus tinctorius Marx 270]